jgi:hypothetical protein
MALDAQGGGFDVLKGHGHDGLHNRGEPVALSKNVSGCKKAK